MLGMNYNDFAYVPAANTRGGIIVAAHSPEVALQDPHIDCYLATVKVVSMSNEPWWLSVVYGPQHEATKALFLEELETIRDQCQGPWAIIGDFNLILDDADKSNTRINRRSMQRFRRTVASLQLLDIHHSEQFDPWKLVLCSSTVLKFNFETAGKRSGSKIRWFQEMKEPRKLVSIGRDETRFF
jgi:hypothetical protein